jgi:hypothetical protein
MNDMETTLEQLIDSHSLIGVLEALAAVCHGKAQHVRSNWQDEDLARCWDKAGFAVVRAEASVRKVGAL